MLGCVTRGIPQRYMFAALQPEAPGSRRADPSAPRGQPAEDARRRSRCGAERPARLFLGAGATGAPRPAGSPGQPAGRSYFGWERAALPAGAGRAEGGELRSSVWFRVGWFFFFPFPSSLSLPFPPHYSNQRQPDKNAPSVDNGPAFLLASLLCSFAERKKVSSPPPFSPSPPRGRLLRKSRHGATGPRSAPPGPGRAPRGGRGTHTQVAPQPGAPLPHPPCQRDEPFLPCRRGAGGGCPLCIGLQGIGVAGR